MRRSPVKGTFPLLATLVTVAVLSLASAPAFAQIAAPAGDAGFWSSVNGIVQPLAVTAVGGTVSWAALHLPSWIKVKVTAQLEEQVRQTALTGVYLGIHEGEVALDKAITPLQRQQIITRAVTWVTQRLPGPAGALARLGIGQDVVQAIVIKMLGQVQAQNPAFDLGDIAGVAPASPARG